MKFDICVGNPPYSKNLHLKIINTVINHLTEDGTASFIHPARWLQDPLAEYKKGTDKVKFKNIVDRLDDVKVIDNNTAITKFNIRYNGELMLSKIKAKPTGKHITGYNAIAFDSIDVILKYSKEHNLAQVDEEKKVDGWRCHIYDIIPLMSKSHDGDSEYSRKLQCDLFSFQKTNVFFDGKDETGTDWTQLKKARNQYEKKEGTPFPHSIKFKSKEEALNFQASCRTNFYRNIMYMLKLDMNTPLDFLPWMKDYSHTWTDEDYCKFFAKYGMSEECQKWMCRDVYDYRIKDFINYMKFDDSKLEEYSETESVDPDSSTSGSVSSKTVLDN